MRGAPRRPALVGGIALLVTISVLAVGYVIAPNHTSTYRNDVIGYSLTVPPGWQQLQLVAGSEVPDLASSFAQTAFFANGPASVLDDQPITSHDTFTNLPDGGVLVYVSPTMANPYMTALSDDWNYPPAPALGTPDSETPNWSGFRAQGVHFEIGAGYGPHTTADDSQEANALATSISIDPAPAPPSVGTAVARFPAQPNTPAWRIGTPDRFPPGSVVQLSIEAKPGNAPSHHLFIVTPKQPEDEYVRWTVSDWGAPCRSLSWDGKVFRCGGRSWKPNGDPIAHTVRRLAKSSIAETWDGQLITSYNGVVEFP